MLIGSRIIVPSVFAGNREEFIRELKLYSSYQKTMGIKRLQIDYCDYPDLEKTILPDQYIAGNSKVIDFLNKLDCLDWHIMSINPLPVVQAILNLKITTKQTFIIQYDARWHSLEQYLRILKSAKKLDISISTSLNPDCPTSQMMEIIDFRPDYVQIMGYRAGYRGQEINKQGLEILLKDLSSYLEKRQLLTELFIEGGLTEKVIYWILGLSGAKRINGFGINITRL